MTKWLQRIRGAAVLLVVISGLPRCSYGRDAVHQALGGLDGELKMRQEVITRRDDLVIRRLVLGPGESMPWHTDTCHRFSVVVRGEQLRIEFRDTGEQVAVAVHPGMAGWDPPEARVHRGVNTGADPYEEVVMFFLAPPGIEPQPEHI
jgi:hypothetical protein